MHIGKAWLGIDYRRSTTSYSVSPNSQNFNDLQLLFRGLPASLHVAFGIAVLSSDLELVLPCVIPLIEKLGHLRRIAWAQDCDEIY